MSWIEFLRTIRVQSCLKCGSLRTLPGLFCPVCWEQHQFDYQPTPLGLKLTPLLTRYLLRWNPGLSDSLSTLFHLLKGNNQALAWRFFAKQFRDHYLKTESLEHLAKTILVPIPSSEPRIMDHASLFCEALSEQFALPIYPLLKKPKGMGAQKERKRQERDRIRFLVNENISAIVPADKRIILVDDISTTGATLKAACRALKRPERTFEAWVLAYRTL